MDVTDMAQVQGAAASVASLDILINNAGLAVRDDLSDRATLERHLSVNLLGTYDVTAAFLPLLTRSRGVIVNVLSRAAFAPLPAIPAYSVSNAAAFSLSQSLRAVLGPRGVTVHVVIAGPIDTELSRDFDVAKHGPETVARGIFDGIEQGDEEIFPDPTSQTIAESWRASTAKALERQYATAAADVPAGLEAAEIVTSSRGTRGGDDLKVIEEFRANGGRVGGRWAGTPLILIHHIGVKSGLEHITPLGCFEQGNDRFVIVASNGGSLNHPAWYHNVKARPRIEVELGGERFTVLAEELDEKARARLWPTLVADAPQIGEFQAKIARRIPVFMLSREG